MRLKTDSRAFVRYAAGLIIMPETDVIKKDLNTGDNDQGWFTSYSLANVRRRKICLSSRR
jgi:hypothetical protein